jgi:predicted PurR-regulated permease PerM
LPAYVQDVTDWVNKFAAKRGWDFKIDLTTEKIQQYVTDNREAIVGVLGGVRSFAFSVIHILITLIIGIILSIYILLDLPKIQRSVRAMLPENRRDEIVGLTEKIGGALGGFFRGQLLVAMFVGIASAALLTWPARIPFAIVVGLIAGVFNLVPLIGPFIGAIPAVILGLLSGDPKRAWIGALMLLLVQQIDNHIISPNVMGRTVKLHPITVMLALLAAGSLFGIFGMLLIIPTIAAVKAVAQHLWSKRTVRDALAEAYPGGETPAVFAESDAVVSSVDENGEDVVVEESTTVVKTAGDGKGGRRPRAKRRPSRSSQASSSRKRSR